MKNSLELHPLATLFPEMSQDEYGKLREDIRVNGLQEPLTTWRGKLIDGTHRDAVCLELGIQPDICELEDSVDPTVYVLSKNLYRRHLTQSQRAQCAAEVAKMRLGDNQHKTSEGSQICLAIDDAAKAFSVSPSSVKTAKHVADKGDRAVVDAVKSGAISVSAAAKLVDAVPDKEAQQKAVNAGKQTVAIVTRQAEANAQQGRQTKRKVEKSKARKKREEQEAKDNARLKAVIAAMPADKNNAVAYIRAALGDGNLHSEPSLFSPWSESQLIAAYVNESPSTAQTQQRLDRLHPVYSPGHLGREIIIATLAAMVWLGIVKMDGDGEHAAYRLLEPEAATTATTAAIEMSVSEKAGSSATAVRIEPAPGDESPASELARVKGHDDTDA